MHPEAALRARVVFGLALVLGPILPIFQTGRYSTLRGAIVTAVGSVAAVLVTWLTRSDPEFSPRWWKFVGAGIAGGVGASVVVALATGANVPTIVQFLWIPLLRSIVVTAGICLMLGSTVAPMPPAPNDVNASQVRSM